jgi:hypothetical protein
MENKINQQENIREISRERMIEQIQLIRGGLKNNKKWNHKKSKNKKCNCDRNRYNCQL